MEDEDDWHQSKTSENAKTFFISEKNTGTDSDNSISFGDISKEYVPTTELNSSYSNKSNSTVIKQQSLRDELGCITESDKPTRQCNEVAAKAVIKKIILHKEYTFKAFSDVPSKLLLLDVALNSYEENAILKVLIFVKDTLKPSQFNLELLKRPQAVKLYISYLKRMNHSENLLNLYGFLNAAEDAAMLRLKEIMIQETTPQVKIENIRKCLGSHFSMNSSLHFESMLIKDYSRLLQLQIQIQKIDSEENKKLSLSLFNRIPLNQPLFGRSLVNTLQYCCIYHYSKPENHLLSPHYLKKEFLISNKHFQWQCLKSRCILSYWNEVEQIFLAKNFFGIMQMKSALGFENVLKLLYKYKAPKEVLIKYCDLIDDSERRIEIAIMYQCPESAIKAFRKTRNKLAFDRFKLTLAQNTPAHKLAIQLENDLTMKWKT